MKISCLFKWSAALCGLLWTLSGMQADPGDLFRQRKAALVQQYDANQDGRLDAKERETMRQAHLNERPSSRGMDAMIPPELLAAFDKDGDGALSDAERQTMDQEMGQRYMKLLQTYDLDKDQQLGKQEVLAVKTALTQGAIKGLDAMVAGFITQMMHRSSQAEGDGQLEWMAFDKNGNGRADAEELEAIRSALKGRATP